MSSTKEIDSALTKLSHDTINKALKSLKLEEKENMEDASKAYIDAVLASGVDNFVNRLQKHKDIYENACSALKTKELGALLKRNGFKKSVETLDENLLKDFSTILNLTTATRQNTLYQIEDEVMLAGMEEFLKKLSVEVLKLHCSELSISKPGNTKDDLAER